MTLLDQARRALTDLALRAEWLEDSLLNGTPRPYRAPHLTGEARAAADAAARAERHERVAIAPGDSPDPFSFEVSELREDLLIFADNMAGEITQTAGVDRLPDASWDSDPQPYLEAASRWLLQASEVAPDLPAKVLRKATQYLERADALLGHVTDGQTLPRCCPFCQGRTGQTPQGGALTIRVRTKHRGHARGEDCNAHCLLLLVCEGGMCAPPEGTYGQEYGSHPAWLLDSEGEWLAQMMDRVDAGRTCRCGEPLPLPSRPGRPVEYCSDECRRAANAERMAAARAA